MCFLHIYIYVYIYMYIPREKRKVMIIKNLKKYFTFEVGIIESLVDHHPWGVFKINNMRQPDIKMNRHVTCVYIRTYIYIYRIYIMELNNLPSKWMHHFMFWWRLLQFLRPMLMHLTHGLTDHGQHLCSPQWI